VTCLFFQNCCVKIEERDNIMYQKGTDKIFNGTRTEFYDNGEMALKAI
jgi:hypothetical protein